MWAWNASLLVSEMMTTHRDTKHGDIDRQQKPQADREENIFIPLSLPIIQIESESMKGRYQDEK